MKRLATLLLVFTFLAAPIAATHGDKAQSESATDHAADAADSAAKAATIAAEKAGTGLATAADVAAEQAQNALDGVANLIDSLFGGEE